jgi:hypothetical protein
MDSIASFQKYEPKTIISDIDSTSRDIKYIHLQHVSIVGRNACYPNCLCLIDNKKLLSPYDEKVMSLNKEIFYDKSDEDYLLSLINNAGANADANTIEECPVYFFIYNFDNYFHFIYDTIPYLYTFTVLKKTYPNMKLLVSYPNPSLNKFYKFNEDIFDIFNIRDDLLIHKEGTVYNNVYIGNSLTHGGLSNNPPRNEVYQLFRNITLTDKEFPKKIYISRRSWIHNDKSNMGTDYTERRKLVNEDELVAKLCKEGFTEVFCENMSMIDKIVMFNKAEVIVGAIGGGMCNLLFSTSKTKVLCIVSPYFLDINYRFRFSMDHTNIEYIYDTQLVTYQNKIPIYIRVKIIDINSIYYQKIGEIIGYNSDKYIVQISNNDVAGFNNLVKFNKEEFYAEQFETLDKGLNSPYMVDINAIHVLKLD